MTTTVLTLTVTGIASDSRLAGGTDPRILRRASSVILMLAGALLGAVPERQGLGWPVVLAALIVIAGLVPAMVPPRAVRQPHQPRVSG